MATLKFAIPGIGGSLGLCPICGDTFLKEILCGESVPSLGVGGLDRDIPAHKKCAKSVVSLSGPWKDIRDKFPHGPMFDFFEQTYQEQTDGG